MSLGAKDSKGVERLVERSAVSLASMLLLHRSGAWHRGYAISHCSVQAWASWVFDLALSGLKFYSKQWY